MTTPRVEDLPEPLRRAACGIARRLATAGERGWIVGGTVRDLALARRPQDVDMATAALPETVERLFERTVAVGRQFGTVIVVMPEAEVEVTTFRSESSYSDGRRPDRVHYGATVEEDAARRDFSCNALYLDPLTGEVRDPVGGLGDLRAGLLRAVGEARRRFEEDRLRLLRMARFQAALNLEPAEGLHDAARAVRHGLSAVSSERVRAELVKLFEAHGAARGIAVMRTCGLLEEALPGWRAVAAGDQTWDQVEAQRQRAFEALPDPPGVGSGLALLLEVDPLGTASPKSLQLGKELAEGLRLSRAEQDECVELWRLRRELLELASTEGPRSQRILTYRSRHASAALRLAEAWARAQDQPTTQRALRALRSRFEQLSPEELNPDPWITTHDLQALGIERGPRWGQLLREAEILQLDGAFDDRDAARAWLRSRAEEWR